MNAVTLLYHDVIGEGADWDSSGRPGAASATFKLAERDFDAHLDALRRTLRGPPRLVTVAATDRPPGERHVMLTFDDGGESARSLIADRLEALGWRGHFMVASDYVGRRGYLGASCIRDLRSRGHVIGTHSASHPTRMSALSRRQLGEEWRRSAGRLTEILGEAVEVGSVPGGYYSREVAETAAGAGVRFLFTSEPTTRCKRVRGCLVLGRFSLRRDSGPAMASGLARARLWLRVRESAFWLAKKAAKTVGGASYLRVRTALLR